VYTQEQVLHAHINHRNRRAQHDKTPKSSLTILHTHNIDLPVLYRRSLSV